MGIDDDQGESDAPGQRGGRVAILAAPAMRSSAGAVFRAVAKAREAVPVRERWWWSSSKMTSLTPAP